MSARRARSSGRRFVTINGKQVWQRLEGELTKTQAKAAAAKLEASKVGGGFVAPSKETVGDLLGRKEVKDGAVTYTGWLGFKVTEEKAEKTIARYEQLARVNLAPLHSIRLKALKHDDINKVYAGMKAQGLSAQTIQHAHRALSTALNWAVAKGKLAKNPCRDKDLITRSQVRRKKMKALPMADVLAVIEKARGTALYIPCLIAAHGGLRLGEVLALTWGDLHGSTLTINKTLQQIGSVVKVKESPKSDDSERTVKLTPTAVAELKAHRIRKVQEMLALGRRLADSDPIVSTAAGTHVQPVYVGQRFPALVQGTAMKGKTFHFLRHAHASLLLHLGEDIKTISERLGHSDTRITMDLYAHLMEDADAGAAQTFEPALSKK